MKGPERGRINPNLLSLRLREELEAVPLRPLAADYDRLHAVRHRLIWGRLQTAIVPGRHRLPALMAVAFVLLAIWGLGFALLRTAERHSVAVVPYRGLPASAPTQSAFIPGAMGPCRASQLRAQERPSPGNIGGGAVNTSWWDIRIQSDAPAQCFIGSTLQVQFELPDGRYIRATQRLSQGDLIVLGGTPGVSAIGEVSYSEGTPPVPYAPLHCGLPAGTRIHLSPGPGLGWLVLSVGSPNGAVATCAPKDGGEAYVGLAAECPSSGCQGGSLGDLQLSGQFARDSVPAGGELRATLGIVNYPEIGLGSWRSAPVIHELTFKPCPSYTVELEGVPGTLKRYFLNCQDAHPLAANDREDFELIVPVPANAAPGPSVLRWQLEYPGYQLKAVSLGFWIEQKH
jgi:hypothetical protein